MGEARQIDSSNFTTNIQTILYIVFSLETNTNLLW